MRSFSARCLVLVTSLSISACGGGSSTRGGTGGSDETGGDSGGDTGGKGSGGTPGTGGKGSGGSGGGAGQGGGAGAGDTGGAAGGGSGGSAGAGDGGSGGSAGAGGGGSGGAGGGGSGGSAGAGGTGMVGAHKFGSHTFAYPMGALKPGGSQATLDAATADFYDKTWKKLLDTRCGGGLYTVNSGGGTGASPGAFSVSEGHGYGMVIVAMMAGHDPDAQKIFDGMFKAFRTFPSVNVPDLCGWEFLYKGGKCTSDTGSTTDLDDSATDGDLDIAFSLLVAHAQWGSGGAINYLAEAKKVIAAIQAHELNPDTHLIMMGDWADTSAPYYQMRYSKADGPYGTEPHTNYHWGTRPSDFMIDHFKAFGTASGDMAWSAAVDAHYALVARLQTTASASTGLLPDFVVAKTVDTAAPAKTDYLEGPDGTYAYNSCRVPWHLGTAYLATGDARAKAAAAKISAWARTKTGGNPKSFVDGYTLAGAATGSGGNNMAFVAPLGPAAMAGTDQAWVDSLWNDIATTGAQGYYGDSIKMLVMLTMSGNWFQP